MNKETRDDIIGWDIVNWSKSFDYWNQHLNIKDKGYKCLELGARQGGLSLWLALNNNQVICSDVSYTDQQHELDKTIALHKKHGCELNITYEAVDATNIPYENHFDLVVFKSVLGGVSIGADNRLEQQAIDSIYKSLKPGGKVVFVENLEGSPLHMYARKKFVGWGSKWHYLKLNELVSLFSSYKNLKYKTVGFLGAFGKTESQRQFLGKIDTVFEKLLPKSNRYIMIGIAEK
jgi:SAM-dependent methyltransferase